MHEPTPSTEDSIDARPRPHPRTHHPTSARSRLAKVSLPDAEPVGAELVTWVCKEGYVYVPIPPAGTGGHRADRWDVDKWFKALKVELVSIEDDMLVRLSDQETGELFAECPLPGDGTPLTTAVEPVLDSSRYFVLRVVDRGTGKHAFIGLGFRERSDASGFTTGLDEYRKYLLRKAEAERMRQEHEEKEAARAAGGAAGGDGDGAPARDHLALKQNITIQLKAVGSRVGRPWPRTRGAPGDSLHSTAHGEGQLGSGTAHVEPLSKPPDRRPLHPTLAIMRRWTGGQRCFSVLSCHAVPHSATCLILRPHCDTRSSSRLHWQLQTHRTAQSPPVLGDGMRLGRTAHATGRGEARPPH